jgi:hypothetical protein
MSNKRLPKDKPSEYDNHNPIIITQCLTSNCNGYYTDSISETLRIQCKDPRHRHLVEKSKTIEIFPREKNKKAGSSSTGEPTERMASSVQRHTFRSDTPA